MTSHQIIILFGVLNVLMWALMLFYNASRDAYFRDFEKQQAEHLQSACDYIHSAFQSLIDNVEVVIEDGENSEGKS